MAPPTITLRSLPGCGGSKSLFSMLYEVQKSDLLHLTDAFDTVIFEEGNL